jgi:hypothetical protein
MLIQTEKGEKMIKSFDYRLVFWKHQTQICFEQNIAKGNLD